MMRAVVASYFFFFLSLFMRVEGGEGRFVNLATFCLGGVVVRIFNSVFFAHIKK